MKKYLVNGEWKRQNSEVRIQKSEETSKDKISHRERREKGEKLNNIPPRKDKKRCLDTD